MTAIEGHGAWRRGLYRKKFDKQILPDRFVDDLILAFLSSHQVQS